MKAIASIVFVLGLYMVAGLIDSPSELDAAQRTAAAARDVERNGLLAAKD